MSRQRPIKLSAPKEMAKFQDPPKKKRGAASRKNAHTLKKSENTKNQEKNTGVGGNIERPKPGGLAWKATKKKKHQRARNSWGERWMEIGGVEMPGAGAVVGKFHKETDYLFSRERS